MPRVHLLNRTESPGRISCGRAVSRPSQYAAEAKDATCPDCADAHPTLTYEDRNEILENAREHGAKVAAGFRPQGKRPRKWPAPWEACACGRTESRSWDGWFKAGNERYPVKTEKTLHAPKRHGGCGAMPEKTKAA